MNAETLKAALNDQAVSAESTASARSAASSAREQARETVNRMDEKVQLEVAKAVGANVELRAPDPDMKR
jgi:hypothetical protein